jgi:hypothetical protein
VPLAVKSELEPRFLFDLTHRGSVRKLIPLDVAAGREPDPLALVQVEQHLSLMHDEGGRSEVTCDLSHSLSWHGHAQARSPGSPTNGMVALTVANQRQTRERARERRKAFRFPLSGPLTAYTTLATPRPYQSALANVVRNLLKMRATPPYQLSDRVCT